MNQNEQTTDAEQAAAMRDAVRISLVRLRDVKSQAIAAHQIMLWLTRNSSRTGVMRGDSTIMKVLEEFTEHTTRTINAVFQYLDAANEEEDLPF